jgi:hypothetical protein
MQQLDLIGFCETSGKMSSQKVRVLAVLPSHDPSRQGYYLGLFYPNKLL